jgi:predicted TIM-barrel fold metal-dependent hydrolase
MGTVAHLRRELQSAGVGRVTAIHTSTYYRWDNRFTADSARDNSDVMVGICTLDPDDDKSPALLEQYVRDFNIRGMRSIPAQSGRLDDPGVDRLWKMAEELGIVINVLTNREKQSEIEALAGRHPKLRVVIDHCLNLRAGPELDPTLDAMRDLARIERAFAKLSFIPTGSSQQFPCRDMHAPCRAVIGFFGPERCVWGSDFPCQLWCPNVTYSQNLRILTHELGLDEAARRAILAETPRRLWFAPLAT